MCRARAGAVFAAVPESDSVYFYLENTALKEVLPTIHPLDCET